MNTDHHAVVVGIAKYPGFQNLEGPGHDAGAFRDWLQNPAKGGVPPENVRFLTTAEFHPPEPPHPKQTRPFDAEIHNLFYDLVTRTRSSAWVGERLYIYMAGHGFTEARADRNWLTGLYAANADLHQASSVVGTVYAEWFRMWAGFREIVLVMDCCRTQSPVHTLNTSGPTGGPGRPALAGEVRTYYAYATQEGLPARERRIDGDKVQGIFTTALLEAFDRAAPDAEGRVTGESVLGYVHQNIRRLAGPVEIHDPKFVAEKPRDIVFSVRATAPTASVNVHLSSFAGPVEVVIFGRPGEIVRRVRAESADVAIPLSPGYYRPAVGGVEYPLFEMKGADVELTL